MHLIFRPVHATDPINLIFVLVVVVAVVVVVVVVTNIQYVYHIIL